MKKAIAGILSVFFCFSPNAQAEDFFDGLIVSEEMKQDSISRSGQFEAGKILEQKATVLKMNGQKIRKKEAFDEDAALVVREPAPMGLKWLATVEEIRYLHIRLTPIELKDIPNSYKAANLPKPVSDFREVIVSFGNDNALWRIAAYGRMMNDDSRASKGVAAYNKYYKMLERKYGNAQQFYTPAVINIEESVPNADGTTGKAIKQSNMEIGADGFLQKLESGEAVLYATFDNGRIGVTLALLADGKGQTYIIVDYKYLQVTLKEDEDIYDAL